MLRRAFIRVSSATKFSTLSIRNASSTTTINSLYKFTEEEEMFKSTVKKFVNQVVKPKVAAMDEAAKIDPGLLSALFGNGMMGIEIPSEYGGAGAGFFSSILAIEEIAKVDPSISLLVDVQNTLISNIFCKHASEDQRKRYLPRLATDTVGSWCISEVSSGSDAFALKTTAKRPSPSSDHFILNGTKMWISNSNEAGIFIVFANAKPEDGYRGITCFIVEKSFPGVTIYKKENKLGICASSTCPVHFDNVKVPTENVIGQFGKGYKYAIELLNEGRIGIAAMMLGLAQGAFNLAVNYTKQRKQFGKTLIEFQAMQHQMADTAMQIEAARLLVYNAARLKQEAEANVDHPGKTFIYQATMANKLQDSFVYQAAMAKLFSSQVAQLAASRAIDWMGGVGYVKAEPGNGPTAEKFYRDAKIGTIVEGTSNIQLNTIAKFIVDGKISG